MQIPSWGMHLKGKADELKDRDYGNPASHPKPKPNPIRYVPSAAMYVVLVAVLSILIIGNFNAHTLDLEEL